ncbi:MAG: hypothetical protein ACYTG0_30960 [Planctomycetota bacterium]|jgi:hypothetical protein
MLILQYTASIAFLVLGGLVAVINAWIFIGQVRGKQVPSVLPLIGGTILFLGALQFPGGTMRPWAWIGMFIDYGCLPYVVMALISVWLETLRYSAKKRILCLEYETDYVEGSIDLFPKSECIYKWSMKDKGSYGSMIMRVQEYVVNARIVLSLENICLALQNAGDGWFLERESGWQEPRLSLANARIEERPLTTECSGRTSRR